MPVLMPSSPVSAWAAITRLPPIDANDLGPGASSRSAAILATGGPVSTRAQPAAWDYTFHVAIGDDAFRHPRFAGSRRRPGLAVMIITPGETTSYSVVFSRHGGPFCTAPAPAPRSADDVRYDEVAGRLLARLPAIRRAWWRMTGGLVAMYRRERCR